MQTYKHTEFNEPFHNLTEDTTFIDCRFIGIHGDGVVCNGSTVIFKNCVFDNTGIEPADSDEAITLIKGAKVTVENCYFKHWGKGILVSNGDWAEDIEKNNCLNLSNTTFEECGRRHPYIRYGTANIKNCTFKNWGIPGTYELKCNGIRVGMGAVVNIEDCKFIQEKFTWSFSDIIHQFDPTDTYKLDKSSKWYKLQVMKVILLHPFETFKQCLPGVCKGIMTESTGKVNSKNCKKNKWWIWLD